MPQVGSKELWFQHKGQTCRTLVAQKDITDTIHLMKMVEKDELPEGKVCFVKCLYPNNKVFTLHVHPEVAREFRKQLEP